MSILLTEMTYERALEVVDEMTRKEKVHNETTEIWQGDHPKLGTIYVMIPALGNPITLPFVVRGFNI